uniref:Uncharacterized protein n=1 Tax=Paramoeba aestuarina TaxID=180227 RepID=A0A7S4NPY9_9EUKA
MSLRGRLGTKPLSDFSCDQATSVFVENRSSFHITSMRIGLSSGTQAVLDTCRVLISSSVVAVDCPSIELDVRQPVQDFVDLKSLSANVSSKMALCLASLSAMDFFFAATSITVKNQQADTQLHIDDLGVFSNESALGIFTKSVALGRSSVWGCLFLFTRSKKPLDAMICAQQINMSRSHGGVAVEARDIDRFLSLLFPGLIRMPIHYTIMNLKLVN